MEEKKLKINLVKTDNGICFISDCMATDGYYYTYHNSTIKNLYFDGKLPSGTFTPNWYQIEKYPILIQRKITGERTNERWEIKDEEMISKKLPKVITKDNKEEFEYDIRESFYDYKYDTLPKRMEDVEVEIVLVLEVDNFKAAPVIKYGAVRKVDFSDKPYEITNTNVNHQWFDKMIFPEVLLASRPCSFSSKQVYDITRQYVRDHIDGSKAKITSDYDFCFTVRKIVSLIEPETISYQNIFARTKKERNKIHYKTKKFNEVDIFEMTHDQSRYQNYTVIKPIFGENEEDLKNKMDEWLSTLIEIINKPLEMCSHCNGTGMVENIKRINQNDVCK